MKKVSLIMLAYNKLDYTKIAVYTMYKYAGNVDFEFISVNNGSSDGTKEYFDSLPNEKKINFEENVGGDRAFNEAIKQAEGEYTVFLNNDIIFTENWLINLIKVIESDSKIGVVVPACNSSSNYQVVQLAYSNSDELQVVAKEYNKVLDSSKWEERLRLMLYVAIFRTKELIDIGGLDEIYSPGGFDDDDLTCRYRRAGYKLIFAKDIYVHHFGSVTIGEAYATVLAKNREIFKNKLGYDSWNANEIDFNIINNIEYLKNNNSNINLLGVGNTCGATVLQLKNQLKAYGNKNLLLDYCSLETKYQNDIGTICETLYSGETCDLDSVLKDDFYNYIYLDKEVFTAKDLLMYIKIFSKKLKKGGILSLSSKLLIGKDTNIISSDMTKSFAIITGYENVKIINSPQMKSYYFFKK